MSSDGAHDDAVHAHPAPDSAAPDGFVPPEEPEQPETGDERVDAVLARLAGVAELPLREQVAVFEAVHVELQDYVADAAE